MKNHLLREQKKPKINRWRSFVPTIACVSGLLLIAVPSANANYTENGLKGLTTSNLVSTNLADPIKGVVTSSDGEPLIGVTILVKGANIGTVTDFDGSFDLDVPTGSETLVFSYTGFETQEVAIGGRSVIDLQLNESVTSLNEIVVVGYGTQKKANLTGSVDQVSAEVLENRPLVDVSTAMQGVIPNLNITTQNGEPGAGADFNIRGFTSINGGSPLILVDGVEMDPNIINVSDIASVTVLKDAGAAAIYGARGAFGVVLITTKTGEKGKTRITFNENFIFSRPTITPDVLDNSYDQAVAINEAIGNFDGSFTYSDERLAKIKAHHEDPSRNPAWEVINGSFQWYGYNDWEEELYRNFAPTQKHSLSASGGNERTTFYTSLGYSNQEGLHSQATDFYKKFNISLGVQDQTFKWLKSSIKVGYNSNVTNRPHIYKSDESPENRLVFSSSLGLPTKYPGDDPAYVGRYFNSPASTTLLGGRNESRLNQVFLNGGLTAEINPYLSVVGNFNYNIYRNTVENYKKRIAYLRNDFSDFFGESNNDNLYLRNTNTNYYTLSSYIQYERTLADDFYVKGMVGFNQEKSDGEWFSSQRFSLINPNQPAINLATGDQQVDGDKTTWGLRGAFTRLNFIYKDKYLFEFNGRYDGSSRFPKESRFGFFPSYSAGWRVSQEQFMQGLEVVSNFKIRASYGTLGNQTIRIGGSQLFYPYIPSMSSGSTGNFLLNDVRDLLINPPGLVSPDLTWEKSTTLDVGFDLSMLRDRFEVVFDWYKRTTSDMLIRVSYPHVLGASAPFQNAAELETKGWELSLAWRESLTNRLKAGFRVVLSDNVAQITKYENKTGDLGDYYEGQTLGEIWGYETQGIFQSDEEVAAAADQTQISASWQAGDIRYADLDGDGIITTGDGTINNPGDRRVIGNATPRYSYGVGSDISYDAFFVNIFFQGVGKRDYWPNVAAFWPYSSQWFQVQEHFLTDTWSPENTDAYFSRPIARETKNRVTQSRFIQNASYIRLKNLTVGYNMPARLINKIGMESFQVYFSGQNLWEYSKIGKPLDPEINLGASSSLYGYPYQRSYAIGFNVTF